MKILLFQFQQAGTGTEGTDYSTISDITISAGTQLEQPHSLQQMTVFMKVTKQDSCNISGVSGADATESGTQSVTITITENEVHQQSL